MSKTELQKKKLKILQIDTTFSMCVSFNDLKDDDKKDDRQYHKFNEKFISN